MNHPNLSKPTRQASQPNAGRRVTMRATERPALPPRPITRDPPSILLIDDDPAVLESLRRVLASEGWRIVTAMTGEEGLERLQEEAPDLMITDLRMASVTGWDLLFHENLQRPTLPIFVITALPADATGGADEFATEFFQKPLDLDALLTAIHRYLRPEDQKALS